MELLSSFYSSLLSASAISFFLFVFWKMLFVCWVKPIQADRKLRKNGFGGPPPIFPLGNISDMKKADRDNDDSSNNNTIISHDIHPKIFPYFARWQKSHGKVFTFWFGVEPFLYIADPEFLKEMSAGVVGKSWGKPTVFRNDRMPMFGRGLVMAEGDEWDRHRHVITPAFTPANLKAMASSMVDLTKKMMDKWTALINSGHLEIDVEKDINSSSGEIIAEVGFGITAEAGRRVVEKLREVQFTLFKTNGNLGIPFSKLFTPKHTVETKRLSKEIDNLFMSIITSRRVADRPQNSQNDLLGLLLHENHQDGRPTKALSTREVVDECKTFFFGGHETIALALTWTLLLLAMYPEWQDQLREEIKEVVGDKIIDTSLLGGLKKMGWVMNEALRLYSPAANAQRQAREDIRVGDLVIPNGTNMWIDIISMNHDKALWGEDVNQFKPDRFKEDPLYGGCKHKMGYLPFGFGGRLCIGRSMTIMEYKIVMTLLLSKFSFSVSPNYCHCPSLMLSLRPSQGCLLMVKSLQD